MASDVDFGFAYPKKEGTTVCRFCYRPLKECICKMPKNNKKD